LAALFMKQSIQRQTALTAGLSLIAMSLVAAFSYGFVQGTLIVQDDSSATLSNIISSNNLFNAGILGWFVILILDIIVGWALYMFMQPIHKGLSLLGALFRLVYSAILGISILNLVFVFLLTKDSGNLTIFSIDQLQAQVMLLLKAFEYMWSAGLIIFGGHLLILGILALKSTFIPKSFGILLLIASIGYITVHLGNVLLPQFDKITSVIEIVFIIPMTIGELGFGLWLLVRGGKDSVNK
jgi:hypothetical protein